MTRRIVTRQDGTRRVVEFSRSGRVKADWPACDSCEGTGAVAHCPKHGPRGLATCGACLRSWCFDCHPTPASLCPFCNGDERTAADHEYPTPAGA